MGCVLSSLVCEPLILTIMLSVVTLDVSDDGLGVFCLLLLLHRLHCCPQFLVDQSLRCRHYQHVLCHP